MAQLRMNITINIQFSANVLLLTMFVLFTYSCTKENEATGARIYEGERIPMSIKMGARNTTADDDEVIKSVRAIVFNDKNELVYNDVSDASINVDNIYIAPIRAARGYNNIYIICNETPELTEKLAAITLENEIEKVTFSAIGIVAPPPMYGNVSRAYVESRSDGTNATVTINNVTTTELPIEVNRMVSRISFTAIKNITNEDEDFKVTKLNVKVCRMPVATTIGEGQAYTENVWSDDLTISGTGELDYNGTYTINGNNYTIPDNIDFITIPTTYIPEHILSDPQNASQATYLKIDAQCVLKNGSTQVLNCIYLLNIGQEPPKNHNLTRNNHYRIYATITGMGAMGLYAEIVAMEEHDITINWKPIDGLVISDKAADYDAVADTSRNVNIWNDFSVYSGILKAYHSGTGYKDILFKYGSLIAISSPDANTEFTPPTNATILNDVLWYPGSYTPLNITEWADIPYLETDKIPTDNTIVQVAAGKGDPCKLAGLSESQIKTLGIVDNKQWRMATPAENLILKTAAENESNSQGYPSFHWLFSPHNRYRDTNGISQGDRSNGWYWDNNATVFHFSGEEPQNAEIQENMDRQNAYMIRCVRNEMIKIQLEVGIISSPTYQGTETSGNAYFGIISNIPYWTATLVTEGAYVGSTTEFDDFSFVAGETIHTTHGGNTQNIPIYVKRKESTSPRSFRVKVEGIGLEGKTVNKILTVSQSGYDLRAKTGLSSMGNIPQEGGSYTTTINLTPTDVTISSGKLYLQITYGGVIRCKSTEVHTEPNKYSYDVTITIPENNSPSIVELIGNIYLEYENNYTVSLGSPIIKQNGTISSDNEN